MTHRRLLVRGLVFLLAGAIAYSALRAAYGQRPAYVHVRWAATTDAAERERLERMYGLTRGELREGTTWGYYVVDQSHDNLRALVEHPAVEDTHNIHRTAYRIWRTAPRAAYETSRPAWIATLLEWVGPGGLLIGTVLLAGGAFKAWRARAAGSRAA